MNTFRKIAVCGFIALLGICVNAGQASAATSAAGDLPRSKDAGEIPKQGNCSADSTSKDCVKMEHFEGGPSAKGKPTQGKMRESPTGDGNNPMHMDEKAMKSK